MSRREKINQAIELSRDMLRFANEQNWEALAGAEAKRRDLLQGEFGTEAAESMRTFSVEAIKQIQQLDQKIIAVVEDNKNKTQKALADSHRNRKAARQYTQSKR